MAGYKIIIKGQLTDKMLAYLELEADVSSILSGHIPDQSAMIRKVRSLNDLGLEVISVYASDKK